MIADVGRFVGGAGLMLAPDVPICTTRLGQEQIRVVRAEYMGNSASEVLQMFTFQARGPTRYAS